eukprot:642988-Pelagomonas_calceolata.AAC.1
MLVLVWICSMVATHQELTTLDQRASNISPSPLMIDCRRRAPYVLASAYVAGQGFFFKNDEVRAWQMCQEYSCFQCSWKLASMKVAKLCV